MRIVLMTIALLLPITSLGVEPAAKAEDSTSMGAPVSQDTLDEQRGGDDDQVNNVIRITGEVTDNTAQDVVTGANNIQDGSFVNSSGITSVVQNTGANVLIQTATIVNVQFTDP
jgi:hypothetical protein